MNYELKNEELCLTFEERGAQLCSITDLKNNREVLWNADPAFWGYHAPVLFPFVGKVYQGKYRYRGTEYSLGQHGFARTRDFTFAGQTENSVTFCLEDDEASRKIYPFAFRLEITHVLEGRDVKVQWKVTNPDTDEVLYFNIGAHPAFMTPPTDAAAKNECYLLFEKDKPEYILVDLSQGAADPEHKYQMETEDGYVKIRDGLFDIDTFIFENCEVEKVSLCGPDKKPYVTVTSKGFPYFGIWTPSDQAPFVCLEPWMGRLDDVGFDGDLSEKKGIQKLEPGQVFESEYVITIK